MGGQAEGCWDGLWTHTRLIGRATIRATPVLCCATRTAYACRRACGRLFLNDVQCTSMDFSTGTMVPFQNVFLVHDGNATTLDSSPNYQLPHKTGNQEAFEKAGLPNQISGSESQPAPMLAALKSTTFDHCLTTCAIERSCVAPVIPFFNLLGDTVPSGSDHSLPPVEAETNIHGTRNPFLVACPLSLQQVWPHRAMAILSKSQETLHERSTRA
jgi:hypothetical protein